MRPTRIAAVGGLLLAGTQLLAACGGGYGAGSGPSSSSTTQSGTGAATRTSAAKVGAADSSFGSIVVDGRGMTLYTYSPDVRGKKSNCEAGCLALWPALTGTPTAGTGVEKKLLGTIRRSDGTPQATYDGWPLYRFAQDSAPGDVKGQGLDGIWYVVRPDGSKVTQTSGGGGGGYGY
ncbi:COG4315 family predicted lipoprotein [Nocardioides mesophilus]|uniref:Lipoprotein with Yx(FWY)xxD motif n=1 Tax=Nocardioides mesophilus TaxID=433659 RepID=A0A7G9R8V8_9ACTN|nr:hypothetical protein [Nocardioides mesophilus]QNN52033.1 hypothetical protein H9L09_16175 [Nocardioides mesophilus]